MTRRTSTATVPRIVGLQRGTGAGASIDTASQLALVAVLSLCLMGLAVVFLTVLYDDLYGGNKPLQVAAVVVGLIVSAGLLLALRRSWVPARAIMIAALGQVLVTAEVFAILSNDVPWPREILLPGWSPVVVWALSIVNLLGFRPWPAFFAVLAATATDPITALALDATGDITLPATQHVLFRFAPCLAAPIIAFVIAQLLERFRRRLAEVRALGAYQLTELLGKGGMGEVWRASHRILKRDVAVKLIAPGHDATDAAAVVARFEQEAHATARLQSPHTVHVYDFGAESDGTFYYVMELLDGIDLHALVLRFGPQPAERVVPILIQACQSLGEAHAHGMIHRDVKPANITLCRYGGLDDFVKVLDFGLVKHRAPADVHDSPSLTAEGVVRGTPAYMAPEQTLGDGVDARTDIYGLGCVAFRLLVGRDPFEGDNPTKVMFAHLQHAAPLPSSVSELPIPPELDAIVLRCLAKKPDERWASTSELAKALEAVPLPRAWGAERAREWWRKQLPAGSR